MRVHQKYFTEIPRSVAPKNTREILSGQRKTIGLDRTHGVYLFELITGISPITRKNHHCRVVVKASHAERDAEEFQLTCGRGYESSKNSNSTHPIALSYKG